MEFQVPDIDLSFPQIEGSKKSVSFSSHMVNVAKKMRERALSSLPLAETVSSSYPSFGEKISEQAPPRWAQTSGKIAKWSRFAHDRSQHRLPSLPTPPQVGHYYSSDLFVTSTADESHEWKKEMIRSAKQSIELSANFAGGEKFQEILELIEQRLQEVPLLKAHLLLSPDFLKSPGCREKLRHLQEAFPERFQYLIHGRSYHVTRRGIHTEENHVKLLIVDEKYFVMGGTSITNNLSSEYATPSQSTLSAYSSSSRDNDIAGESLPLAKVMRQEYFNLLQICERHVFLRPATNKFFSVGARKEEKGICQRFQNEHVFRKAKVKVLVGGPEHGRYNPITFQYIKRIERAQHHVRLAHMFFFPDRRILQTLKKKRGSAHITLITGKTYDRKNCTFSQAGWRSRLQYAIPHHTFEYSHKPGQLFHKKVALFDTSHAIIGSYNLGKKSAFFDHEIICVIKDPRVVSRFQTLFEEDRQRSQEIVNQGGPLVLRHLLGAIAKLPEQLFL